MDLAFCITALLAGFFILYSQLVSCLLTYSCILTTLFKHVIYVTLQIHIIIILQISASQQLPACGSLQRVLSPDTFPEVHPPRVCEQTKAETSPSLTWEQLNGHGCLGSPAQRQPPPPAGGAAIDQPATAARRSLTERSLEEALAVPRRVGDRRKGPVRRCPTPLPGRGQLRDPSRGEQRVGRARSGRGKAPVATAP